jgi:hypothetical protein
MITSPTANGGPGLNLGGGPILWSSSRIGSPVLHPLQTLLAEASKNVSVDVLDITVSSFVNRKPVSLPSTSFSMSSLNCQAPVPFVATERDSVPGPMTAVISLSSVPGTLESGPAVVSPQGWGIGEIAIASPKGIGQLTSPTPKSPPPLPHNWQNTDM